ncbi:MAG TPA: hypothetical protein VKV06_05675 [Acidimicrobiales bacterium]|nr:hypothetical protein [Acidimicrobiales bacterium]
MLLAAGGSVADGAGRPDTVARSVHSGSWTATGICPFDYWFDTSGQSYQDVTTSGTLSGFTPGKTYYVYDNQGTATTETPAAVIANARGRIVLHAKNLDLPGPALFAEYPFSQPGLDSAHPSERHVLHYYVSRDPHSQTVPPGQRVYTVPTTLTVNRSCNPWTAPAGTVLTDAPMENMSNGTYGFGANDQTGNYKLLEGTKALWSTGTTVPAGTYNTMVMQRDGNLVVYDGSKAQWSSGTAGHPGAHLALGLHGTISIVAPDGKVLWQRS